MADAVLVKKSNVPLDLVMFDNADTDPGLGSYQMVPGSYTFYVKHPTMIESLDRTCVDALQVPYMMDSAHDEDKVIVPTVSSICLLYTSPSPRDLSTSRMPSSA